MKYTFLLLFTATLFSYSNTLKLSVENKLDFGRSEEMVELDVNRLAKKLSALKAGETYIVSCENEVMPSQITFDGKLIFQSHLGASQKLTYYTGFGWTKSEFKTVEDFRNYTKRYYQAVKQPFIIKFK